MSVDWLSLFDAVQHSLGAALAALLRALAALLPAADLGWDPVLLLLAGRDAATRKNID